MIDRRIVFAVLFVIVVAAGAHAAMSTSPSPDIETQTGSEVSPPVPIAASPRVVPVESTPATSPVAVTTDDNAASPNPVASTVDEVTSRPEVVDLVEARRPTIDAIDSDIGHDDGHADPTRTQLDLTDLAAELVVVAWTWRFDDTSDRQHDALAAVGSPAVVDALTPSGPERERRHDNGEVAWVIVRDVVVDATVVTVRFDHHVVSSTSAETVTRRVAVVSVEGGVVIEVTS